MIIKLVEQKLTFSKGNIHISCNDIPYEIAKVIYEQIDNQRREVMFFREFFGNILTLLEDNGLVEGTGYASPYLVEFVIHDLIRNRKENNAKQDS